MNKVFQLNPENNKVQNLFVMLILSPLLILGAVPLIIGVTFVIISLVAALPIFILFYNLGLIKEKIKDDENNL